MEILKESDRNGEKQDDYDVEKDGVEVDSKNNEEILTSTGIVGPPSPLTGCYLMIILAEPYSEHHKDIIIQRLVKGFLSWDSSDYHVELADELNTIANNNPEIEEGRNGEKLIQYASENLVTEILIHPTFSTLIQCMRNMLSSFTRHKHIIHSGYTFSGNGSWILQDGTFSVSDFIEIFHKHDVQRVLHAYPDTISINIHCSDSGLWNALPDKSFTKICKIKVNPVDVLDSGDERINNFIEYLSPIIDPTTINDLLETSDVVGNIRFSHPTLYVFPGGQGDAALFGINGFNMLIDGGFNRKACFWDFVRHLDRLDAVLLTRLNNSTINGISAVLERKLEAQIYPQIGHFFCNIPDAKNAYSADGGKDKDEMVIDLMERGYSLVQNLKKMNLKPHQCYHGIDPINLYHKVGHGTLDMYVISPSKDSKEVKEFISKWNNQDKQLFMTKDTKQFNFPLQNLVSICALLVWQPANPNDTITRILFPGSTPGPKIQDGLQKLKNIDFMKFSTCSKNSLSSTTTKISKRPLKSSALDKSKLPTDKDNKQISDNCKSKINQIIANESSDLVKEEHLDADDNVDALKKDEIPETKVKVKAQKPAPRSKKMVEKKIAKDSVVSEKRRSPATTPKKVPKDIKSKPVSRVLKSTMVETAPKSTKDANNLKVLESKQKSLKLTKKDTTTKLSTEKKDIKSDKKPISRRPRGLSPAKKAPGSPIKAAKLKGDIKKSYIDSDAPTADSSAVSTPSNEEIGKKINEPLTKMIDEEKQRELDDLKEEQEVVREIEEVFNRSERLAGRSISKQDSATEVEEEEEYLIIEKEEIDQYTEDSINEPESSITKEEEFQKHQRDSQESEKQRKSSVDQEKFNKDAVTDENFKPIGKESIENLNEELDEIITAARDIVKIQAEELIQAEDTENKQEENQDTKDPILPESLPEDKFSATVESGATTTAPTLPEDERMTLDEIKENVEKEEVKLGGEAIGEPKELEEVSNIPPSNKLLKCVLPIKMIADAKSVQLKDMVKTPDEVADLPMHEEVDLESYEKHMELKDDSRELMPGEIDQLSSKEVIHLHDNEKDNVVSLNIDDVSAAKDDFEQKTPIETKEVFNTVSSPIDNASFDLKAEDKIALDYESEKGLLGKGEMASICDEVEAPIKVLELHETSNEMQFVKRSLEETVSSPIDVPEEHDFETFKGESELRETHITNVCSPIIELRGTIGIDDLHDIAEEDEERKLSSPSIDPKLVVNIEDLKRPLSPREEEVFKIVADVAKVLKSSKDITEIIPNFDEEELERKIVESKKCSPSEIEVQKEKDVIEEINEVQVVVDSTSKVPDAEPVEIKSEIKESQDELQDLTGSEALLEEIADSVSRKSSVLSIQGEVECIATSPPTEDMSKTVTGSKESLKQGSDTVSRKSSVLSIPGEVECIATSPPTEGVSKAITGSQESLKQVNDTASIKGGVLSIPGEVECMTTSTPIEDKSKIVTGSQESLKQVSDTVSIKSSVHSSPRESVVEHVDEKSPPKGGTTKEKTGFQHPLKEITDSVSIKSSGHSSPQEPILKDSSENIELLNDMADSTSKKSSVHSSPRESIAEKSAEVCKFKDDTSKIIADSQESLKEVADTVSIKSSVHSSPRGSMAEKSEESSPPKDETSKIVGGSQESLKDIVDTTSIKTSAHSSPPESLTGKSVEIGKPTDDTVADKAGVSSPVKDTFGSQESLKDIVDSTSIKGSAMSSPRESLAEKSAEISQLKDDTSEIVVGSQESLKEIADSVSIKSSLHSSPRESIADKAVVSSPIKDDTTKLAIDSQESLKDIVDSTSTKSSVHSSPRGSMAEKSEESSHPKDETSKIVGGSQESLKDIVDTTSIKTSAHSSPPESLTGKSVEIFKPTDDSSKIETDSQESLKEIVDSISIKSSVHSSPRQSLITESQDDCSDKKDIADYISIKSSVHSSPRKSLIDENDGKSLNKKEIAVLGSQESLKEIADSVSIKSSIHSSPRGSISEKATENVVSAKFEMSSQESLKENVDTVSINTTVHSSPHESVDEKLDGKVLSKVSIDSQELRKEIEDSTSLRSSPHSSRRPSVIDESEEVSSDKKETEGKVKGSQESLKEIADSVSIKSSVHSSPRQPLAEKAVETSPSKDDTCQIVTGSQESLKKTADSVSVKSSVHSSPRDESVNEKPEQKIISKVSMDSQESIKQIEVSISVKSSAHSSRRPSAIDESEDKSIGMKDSQEKVSQEIVKEITDSASIKSSQLSSPRESPADKSEAGSHESLGEIADSVKSSVHSSPLQSVANERDEQRTDKKDSTEAEKGSHEFFKEITNCASVKSSAQSSPRKSLAENDIGLSHSKDDLGKIVTGSQESLKYIADSASVKSSAHSSPRESVAENPEEKIISNISIDSKESIKEIQDSISVKSSVHSSPRQSVIDESDEKDSEKKESQEDEKRSQESLKEIADASSIKSSVHSSPRESLAGKASDLSPSTDEKNKIVTGSQESLKEIADSISIKSSVHSSPRQSLIDESEEKSLEKKQSTKAVIGSQESLKEIADSVSIKSSVHSSPRESLAEESVEASPSKDDKSRISPRQSVEDETILSKIVSGSQDSMKEIGDTVSIKSSVPCTPRQSVVDDGKCDIEKEPLEGIMGSQESLKEAGDSASVKSSLQSSPRDSLVGKGDETSPLKDVSLKISIGSHESLKGMSDTLSIKSSVHSSPREPLAEKVAAISPVKDDTIKIATGSQESLKDIVDTVSIKSSVHSSPRESLIEKSIEKSPAKDETFKIVAGSQESLKEVADSVSIKSSEHSSPRRSLLDDNEEKSLDKTDISKAATGSQESLKEIPSSIKSSVHSSPRQSITNEKESPEKEESSIELTGLRESVKETDDSISIKSSVHSTPRDSLVGEDTSTIMSASKESLKQPTDSISDKSSGHSSPRESLPLVDQICEVVGGFQDKSKEILAISKVVSGFQEKPKDLKDKDGISSVHSSRKASVDEEINEQLLLNTDDVLPSPKEIKEIRPDSLTQTLECAKSLSDELLDSEMQAREDANENIIELRGTTDDSLEIIPDEANAENEANLNIESPSHVASAIDDSVNYKKESEPVISSRKSSTAEMSDHSTHQENQVPLSTEQLLEISDKERETVTIKKNEFENINDSDILDKEIDDKKTIDPCSKILGAETKKEDSIDNSEASVVEVDIKFRHRELATEMSDPISPKKDDNDKAVQDTSKSPDSNIETQVDTKSITKSLSESKHIEETESSKIKQQDLCKSTSPKTLTSEIPDDPEKIKTEKSQGSASTTFQKSTPTKEIEDNKFKEYSHHSDEENETIASSSIKENRSKSISAVMLTSLYQAPYEQVSESIIEINDINKTPPTAPVSPGSNQTYSNEKEMYVKDEEKEQRSEILSTSSSGAPEEEQDGEDMPPKKLKTNNDPMSTSIYGSLTDTSKTKEEPSNAELSDVYKFLDEAELNFKKALDEHVQLRGADVMTTVTSKYEISEYETVAEEHKSFLLEEIPKTTITIKQDEGSSKATDKKDYSTANVLKDEGSSKTDSTERKDDFDLEKNWGKPSNLPSPAAEDIRTTPKKEKRTVLLKTKINNEKNLKKMSDITNKDKRTPVYVDLTYVPHQSNGYYSHLDFFKNVRARYYVFSSTDPHREVLQALLDAKQLWEDKSLEVTIIPTYDTDTLGYWVSQNEELLAQNRIDLSPSASRCTINLQDHETSCSAYRLEF
ncbi:MAP1B family protein [Megaselia abdita]